MKLARRLVPLAVMPRAPDVAAKRARDRYGRISACGPRSAIRRRPEIALSAAAGIALALPSIAAAAGAPSMPRILAAVPRAVGADGPLASERGVTLAAAATDGGSTGSAEVAFAPLDSTWRMRLNVESNVRGVVVASIAPESPLARLGIARGDVIEAINEEAVDTPEQAAAMLTQFCGGRRGDRSLSILFNRRGVHRFLVDPAWCRNAAAPRSDAGESAR